MNIENMEERVANQR